MNNSSYAVKPELFNDQKEQIKLTFIEEVKDITKEDTVVRLKTNVDDICIMCFEQETIRITSSHQAFDLDGSFSLEPLQPTEHVTLVSEQDYSEIRFNAITVKVNHKPFGISIYKQEKLRFVQKAVAFNDTQSYLFLDRDRDDFIYGLGEKTGFLNKNNEKTTMWNRDVFEPHTRTNKELYQSINVFTHMTKENKYGFFLDNASKVTFDFDSNVNEGVIITDSGKLDYYVFLGDTQKDILRQYTDLSGKPYLPPLWALGYHQSRHSYESVDVLLDVFNNFKSKKIPVDAIYLDILYMERYKVFSFNKETYKGIENVIKKLKDEGVKIVPIVDPGVKIEEGYDVYEEGLRNNRYCKYKDGTVFTGEVWPGDSVFYDFMNSDIRKAWGKNHKFYTDLGIEGIWNDMNEPSVFNGEGNTMSLDVLHDMDGKKIVHQELHNLYGLGMSMATYEGLKDLNGNRPFVLTRAGYSGIQKYATVWTGDNRSSWEHLEMTLPMCLNLGLSGISNCGPDIGGFMDDTTEELLIRWTQIGTFLPFFRNHSSIGIKRQEPWMFGERAEYITKEYIRLRYKIIRYIYSEAFKSHKTGLPIMRPLVLEYENDPIAHGIHDQFLVGETLLVAPILRPDEKYRKVYLPEGIWYDFFTNKRYEGGQFIIVKAELDEIPVFVKGGSIIPMSEWSMNTDQLQDFIKIHVYPSGASFTDSFIVDDGISLDAPHAEIKVQFEGDEVTIKTVGTYDHGLTLDIKVIGD
ncbi:glycoside hydrolase family 31 protein [Haloplasma contractile]|uniref:Alpha-glucosidase protein n=1 Tax=Haloplasma contractile SSD-17B TaxID=1033810 RepID=U2EG41_9MOLU|nr:glycoside hydrolase family 31 protein [Haloplasma contractile]ERJ13878.1 Alpha-glucosidase protein [Haloplasma contractile SSD-17B]